MNGRADAFWRTALFAAMLLGSTAAGADVRYHHDINDPRCCLVIAHAAGGIEGNPYTNSEEAMLANLENGVRVFELDFAKTSDGVWVGTHDWRLWKSQTQYEGDGTPTYQAFEQRRLTAHGARSINNPYRPVTLPFLEKVMARNEKIIVVTDTKYRLKELAAVLAQSLVIDRVYPQAYSPEDVGMLAGMGYKNIILTLYRMSLSDPASVIRRITPVAGKIRALTVPMDFFAANHKALGEIGVPVYTHGAPANINSRELHARFVRLGIAGFYLD